jgi:hypothetical protein
MTEKREGAYLQKMEAPFPPGWIDRLTVWIDRLPGSAWIFYILCILGLGVLINAVFWIDGGMPVGSIDPANSSFAIFVAHWLPLYQYLTGVGSRSLKVFRPLLETDDAETARIEYELASSLAGLVG